MKQKWKGNTAIFMLSQAVSILGSSLVQYAITWYITLETQSGIYMTLSIVFGFLPMFVLSPFAGVWADRYNRKKLIMIADASIAACTLILAFIFMTDYHSIWLLLAALGIRALGSAIQNPCVGAILPDIVPDEYLTKVNGINSTMQSIISLASPMIGAMLFSAVSITYIFLIDVATAAFAIALMLFFFKVPKKERIVSSEDKKTHLSDLVNGFVYIFKNPYLVHFFIYCTIFFIMSAPVAFLTPLQATRNYGGDVWILTAIEVAFSVGMIIGGIVIFLWGGFKNKIYSMLLSLGVMAITTIALGLPMRVEIYLVIMLLFGVVMPMFNTPAMVFLQRKVDPNYLGRVLSIMTMLGTSATPLGMLIYGPLADVISIEIILIVTGALMLATAIFASKDKVLIQA